MYKRQIIGLAEPGAAALDQVHQVAVNDLPVVEPGYSLCAVSYTHLRAHETVLDLVCRLLLEKKKNSTTKTNTHLRDSHLYKSHCILYRTINFTTHYVREHT